MTEVAPSARMAVTDSSTTPARSPRQPAWTAATTPSGLARPTGAQSAVLTTERGTRAGRDGGIRLFRPARPRMLDHNHTITVHLPEPGPRCVS